MRRYHSELPILRRQLREASRLGKSLPAGYYRKHHVLDCGNPRCGICHPEKCHGHTPTRQELAANLHLREQSLEPYS